MYRLSVVLILSIYGALAFRMDYDYELEGLFSTHAGVSANRLSNKNRPLAVGGLVSIMEAELNEWQNDAGRPATSTGGSSKCKKDLLLVVDTSWSIGRDFNRNVKPFLKNLVTNSLLNVGPDGTRIGLVIFGQEDKTKKVFDVGQITSADKLARRMNDALDYNRVGGSYTRTDLGLKIANGIFAKNDPLNERSNIGDVVILMTDGAPRGRMDTRSRSLTIPQTKDEAQKLKDKGILLIVAAVGPDRKNFKPLMAELATSPENVLEADFNNMANIMDKLVASSCIKPGQCKCTLTESTFKLQPDHSSVLAYWPKPEFSCATGREATIESTEVDPPYSSPSLFSIGTYVITYQYNLNGGVSVACPVTITVKGKLCGGKAYRPKQQVCCCGQAHDKKDGYQCCGKDYYNMKDDQCCKSSFSVFPKGVSCPEQ